MYSRKFYRSQMLDTRRYRGYGYWFVYIKNIVESIMDGSGQNLMVKIIRDPHSVLRCLLSNFSFY